MYTGIGNNNNGARGQLFMFFMFIVFILIFTFYKNIIKRDKEIKKQRENEIRQKIEEKILYETEYTRLRLEHEIMEIKRQKNILNKLSKEYMNVCYDLQVFGLRPEKDIIVNNNLINHNNNNNNDNDDEMIIMQINNNEILYRKNNNQQYQKKRSYNNEESEEQMIARRNMISGPIAYLFVIVLIYSLVKAATEISQHFRKKAAGEGEKRRCSLQEYASIKHERKNSKAQFIRRSTIMNMDSRMKNLNRSFEEKHIINYQSIIQEVPSNSGQITEPGSPAKKFTNGLATKPVPLLRRCSVPAFSIGVGNKLRRTSMNDSFSEDDSSPDNKRRVRMIHRH